MPSGNQAQLCLRARRKPGANAVVLRGKAGADDEGFDSGEDGGTGDEQVCLRGELRGDGEKDAVNLGQLVLKEANQVVVELDGFKRLQVNGLPRGGRAVDDARNAPLRFRFDRDDETVAADGDEFVLRGAGFG